MFFIVNFIGVRFIGHYLGFKDIDAVSLNFTTLARNSPLALAIAVAAFPDHPLISLALVIGSLIELPSLAIIAYIINKIRKKGPESTIEISKPGTNNANVATKNSVTVNIETKNDVTKGEITEIKTN